MVSRRTILITGAASAAIIGVGAKMLHSDLKRAREPWRRAGESFGDPRLDALSYAILAPNPHNRQPWLIRLDGDDGLTLFCDPSRLLPETDPPNRQITIGLGAFLELLRQAGAELGYRLETTPFPEGEPQPVLDERPIADVRFIADDTAAKDPLFGAVLLRRTSRDPFDQDRPVTTESLLALGNTLEPNQGAFNVTADASKVLAIKNICHDAWHIELETPHTHQESVRLTRIGEKSINEKPDGISVAGPVMEALRLAGVATAENMADPDSRMFEETRKFYDSLIESSMAFGWLTTEGNSRTDQLTNGAGWMRLYLEATRSGIAMHPLSQTLQEYPEMARKYQEIHELTGVEAPARIQGLFRFGYAKPSAPAPRWPLESRLISNV